jgi:hypothetical protein
MCEALERHACCVGISVWGTSVGGGEEDVYEKREKGCRVYVETPVYRGYWYDILGLTLIQVSLGQFTIHQTQTSPSGSDDTNQS